MKKFVGLIVVCSLVLGFLTQQAYAASKLIKIDGSSTVFPITEAVAEEFQKQHGGIKVMVGISGTGGGFKRFGRGETDISDASRPIKPKEVDLARDNGINYVELPVAYDGLSVMVNPKNTWVNYLTVKELKKIWEPEAQGVITKWSQIRKGFPDKEIRLYEQNKDKLKIVPIDDENDTNGKGPITPSTKSVMDGTYQPLARPIFIYVSTKATEKDEVKKFVEFYLKNAKSLVTEVGYIPLSDDAYQAALGRFQKRITGSVFGSKGATVGVKIEDLLRMEK